MKALILALLLIASPAWAATFTLNWTDNSNNEDGFKIHRRLGDMGVFHNVGTSLDSSHIDTTPDDQKYCYKVNAFNAGGDSGFTDIVCTPTLVIPDPTAPPVVTIPSAPTGLTITITIVVTPTP